MQKRRKKRKKQPHDGGWTVEILKYQYPMIETIKKEYHSLDEKERAYITNWFLKRKMRLIKGICILEAVLMFFQVVLYLLQKRYPGDNFIFVEIPVVSIVCLVAYLLMLQRNKKKLNAIDFNRVQEVVCKYVISSNRGNASKHHASQCIYAWQWNEEKQKYYEIEGYSDVYMRVSSGAVLYHPYGLVEFIPKPPEWMKTDASDREKLHPTFRSIT